MGKRIVLKVIYLIIIINFLLVSCKSQNEERIIRIASIPTEDQQEQLLHLQPLADYLSNETGYKVEFIITNNYTASVEALRSGHVDMAWLGPFSYVLASDLADIRPIVGGIRKNTGDVFYNSIILVRKDSGISSLKDIYGHKFAFVDPASTSGYLFPLAEFIRNGINPEKDFSKVIYAGSHTAVEFAIANKQVDGIADSLPSYELMVKNGLINENEYEIIWKSEPIPPSPLVARAVLGEATIMKIQNALVAAGPDVISFEGEISGYAIVQDGDYDVVREVAKAVFLNGSSK